VALGFSSLGRARGTSIGIPLGWWLVASAVLTNLGMLGFSREGLAVVALERLAPAALFDGPPAVPMSLAAAAVVVVAWAIVPLAVGGVADLYSQRLR
jgi:hypothetical protein